MTLLRPYQEKLITDLDAAWDAGAANVAVILPTGGGKTVIKSNVIARKQRPAVAIAHRQELVSQMSVASARAGVHHRIIAPRSVIGLCVALHMEEFGRSFYHPNSPVAVAGVDTLIRRTDDLTQFLNHIEYWDIDECHHVLKANKWGKAVELFPRARGMGYTATPVRADRKGLSRATTGVFDTMVLGPTMRELIDGKYLSEYRIFAPAASIKREEVKVSSNTGEFDAKDLREKTHASGIVGDVVSSYLRFAPGKLGLTFTVDVEEAERTAAAYRDAGVSAEIVTANTPDHIRVELLKKFRRRQIMQIVNVDILGEGFDVPGVEVVSGARATESFGLYMQQFGRVLRIMEGKTHGIYIDHVDNVRRHGLPDRGRIWSLDPVDGNRRSRQVNDDIPIRTCIECFSPYEAIHKCCPYCGAYPEPSRRDAPEYVDGDLAEYSPELLARMRGEIIRLDTGGAAIPLGATPPIERRLERLWHERQVAQQALRETMQQWAGVRKYVYDESDSMMDRRFYHTFGVDKLTAMTLPRAEAERLTSLIRETMI